MVRTWKDGRQYALHYCASCNWLYNRYKLTKAEWLAIKESQNNRCEICGVDLDSIDPRRISVDHHHETGLIRGLLCNPCNVGLGMLKDSPDNLRAAIRYLGYRP